jgi:sugar phosphate isomerase/epimerase
MDRRFGVSTHVFHDARLSRDHVVEIADRGFGDIEVFATKSHFDYRNEASIELLAEWLSQTGIELHSVHAPIVEAMRGGSWVGSFSNASGDEGRRTAAIDETAAALNIARLIPFKYLVLHLGMPLAEQVPPGDNQPSAAERSLSDIVSLAAAVHVKVAVEIIPNPLSDPFGLVRLVEELDDPDVGICLDYGHAHLMGDLSDAIEVVSGHLFTTHVHDNGGKRDDHLVPFTGGIDWDAAMMETQKIGYDDVLMFEVAGMGNPHQVLRQTAEAAERLEKMFVTF